MSDQLSYSNIAEITSFLRALHPSGPWVIGHLVIGADGLPARRFHNIEVAAQFASELSAEPTTKSVYVSLQQPLDKPLTTLANDDIQNFVNFLVDIDRLEHGKENASAAELLSIVDAAKVVRERLQDLAGADPIETLSGNGTALIYRLMPAPNTAENRALVEAALEGLCGWLNPQLTKFNAVIDVEMSNAGRWTRLCGTYNRKFPETESRPHRLSKAVSVPPTFQVVKPDFLSVLADKKAVPTDTSAPGDFPQLDANFEIDKLIAWANVTKTGEDHKDGLTYHRLNRCPLGPEDADDICRPAFVTGNGTLGFACHHPDCHGKTIKDVLSRLKKKYGKFTHRLWARPDAILLNHELHRYVAEAEQVLVQKEELLYFSRGGDLVKPVLTVNAEKVKGLTRDQFSVIIQSVSGLGVLRDLSANVKFVAYSENKDAYRFVAPTENLANHLIDRVNSGETGYRRLKTVTQAPCLLPSGAVLDKPGYAESVLLTLRHAKFPAIPDQPTQEQAVNALKKFDQLFHKFCFIAENGETWDKTPSYAATLAAVLSLIARPAIPTVPLMAVTAVVRGSGKTKLVEAISQSVIGWDPTRVSYRDEQELEKLLTPLLKGGDRACLIDNISHNLRGDALCGILTSTEFQARILGKSEKLRLLNNTVFFATGNNLTIEGDLARRALLIRLDPGVEQPETLQFDFEPVTRARELYPELVAAALTALRAYIVAGRPWELQRTHRLGSFEEWDSLICGCLVWAGYTDPLLTRQHVVQYDPERESALELLQAWHKEFGESVETTVSEIRKAEGETYRLLCSREGWNPRQIAWRLRRMEGRIIAGYKLTRAALIGGADDRTYWIVSSGLKKKPQPATQISFDKEHCNDATRI